MTSYLGAFGTRADTTSQPCSTLWTRVRFPRYDDHPLPTTGPYTLGTDPLKDALIARVQGFQRMGEEQKTFWYTFCGPTRDPSRHTVNSLRQFCDTYAVPPAASAEGAPIRRR